MSDAVRFNTSFPDLPNEGPVVPGVPDPTPDINGLLSTVEALKETVEIITRKRGDKLNSALFASELELVASGIQSGLGGGTPGGGGGIPGGSAGQLLVKQSTANEDYEWQALDGGYF